MKQILFTAILILAFCFAAFAQESEKQCQKIEIKILERVAEFERFHVSANFKQNDDYISDLIRWKIINGDEIVEKIDKGIIEIEGQAAKGDGSIIILAETVDEKCRAFAMVRVPIQIVCRLPINIDEYGKLPWEAEKARLDNVIVQVKESKKSDDTKDFKLFTFFYFDKTASNNFIRNRLTKILNYLSANQEIKKENIVFLISEADNERVKYQFLPEFMTDLSTGNSLVIKGNDFEKLKSLFQSTMLKNSKK